MFLLREISGLMQKIQNLMMSASIRKTNDWIIKDRKSATFYKTPPMACLEMFHNHQITSKKCRQTTQTIWAKTFRSPT